MSRFHAAHRHHEMEDWIQRYIECKFPIIPLGLGSKAPIARGWTENSYPAGAFRNKNVGTRAGEWVSVDGKEGHLLIVDFDSPAVAQLRQLCEDVPLPRTTCVRTGGVHRGYHLFYLTESATRKRGINETGCPSENAHFEQDASQHEKLSRN